MDMSRMILLAAVACGISVGSPSLAQSPSDVRCLLLSNAFSKGSDQADAKKAAQSASLFYLGKVDGRYSDVQLRATISQQQKTITKANAGPGMQGCMQRMQASAKRLQTASP